MFTYILITVAILLALWLLLHLLSWWLMPGYIPAARRLDAQLSQLEANFDAFELESLRQEQLWRKEQRKRSQQAKRARGAEAKPPNSVEPREIASAPSAKRPRPSKTRVTPFQRFRQKLEAEFAQEKALAEASARQTPSPSEVSPNTEMREAPASFSLPPPATNHPPLPAPSRSRLLFWPFQKLYRAASYFARLLSTLFHRGV